MNRSGCKEMQLPEVAAQPRRSDNTLVKALARAFRWKRMLESGECGSISELAESEKINRSYVCRVLRLTLLAPEIVEAIREVRQPEGLTLTVLMKGTPMEWAQQLSGFRAGPSEAPVDQNSFRH